MNRNMSRQPRQRAFISAIVSLLLFPSLSFHGHANTLPDQLTLIYQGFLGKKKMGDVVKVLSREGDNYHSHSQTRVGLLLSLLAGEITESSRFRVIDGQIQSIHYAEKRTGIKPLDQKVNFDWAKGVVEFNTVGKQKIPATYTIDAGSLMFVFLLGDDGQLFKSGLNIVTGDEIRQFKRQAIREEVIDSSMGERTTRRIDLLRTDKENRSWTLWIDRQHKVPVKIRKQRGDEISILLLKSIEGL